MSQSSASQIRLNADQIEQSSQLLGRAFQADPLMTYILPSTDARRRVLPSLFRVVLRYCLRYGIIFTTEGLEGVACCLPPGQTKPTLGRLVRVSLRGIPGGLGLAGLRRFLHVSKYTDEEHEHAAPGAHWYLWVLGVSPENQGQGTGGRLLQTVLQQARAQGVPCYLETENPRNVPFYQQHGFRLVNEASVSGSNVHVYAMLWKSDQP